ncbi:hypothetical protein HDE78_001625 [Rhodanobacter sp. K2T2]|uniref:hypothetical protein n=1 Tax=Rhodanobacter sp. K2T2 TaxID=2723085 RepID=UPI0015CEDB36|nr:hypothetical protein [Rhodanobacter sp. K2T2]NYE28669.1 hypothetical protein [Rhodanobacter sp. K2T2]
MDMSVGFSSTRRFDCACACACDRGQGRRRPVGRKLSLEIRTRPRRHGVWHYYRSIVIADRAMRRLSSTFHKGVFPPIGLLIPILSGRTPWNASMHSRASIGLLSMLPSILIFLVGLVIYRKPIFDPIAADVIGRSDALRQVRE